MENEMYIRSKYLMVMFCLKVIIITGISCLLPQTSAAQSIDLNSSKNAIATVTRFPAEISKTRGAVSQAPIGPWKLDVHCTYGKFLFWDTKKRHFWWPVDFKGPRSYLDQILNQAEQHGKQFSVSFKPVQYWLIMLPAFSSQFNSASDIILAVQKEINSGIGPNSAQRATVNQQLEHIMARLVQDSTQLKNGRTALANFLKRQNEYQAAIVRAKNNLVASARNVLKRMNDFINQQPCGQGTARNQFNGFQNQLNNSIKTYENALTNLTAQTQQADQAVSILMGTLTSVISSFQPVIQQLKLSQDAPLGGAIQKLRLDVARAQWADLANFSSTQVPKSWYQQFPPKVETATSASCPAVPAGLKVSCKSGADNLQPSPTCPVIKWGASTYWALSHIDNRAGMTIVEYDTAGKIMQQMVKEGARYVWRITVDPTAGTVTFWGQANQTISMKWDEL